MGSTAVVGLNVEILLEIFPHDLNVRAPLRVRISTEDGRNVLQTPGSSVRSEYEDIKQLEISHMVLGCGLASELLSHRPGTTQRSVPQNRTRGSHCAF